MIAPARKSQAGLFQGNAIFARIGSPTLILLASKRWTSSAQIGTGVCAKREYGANHSKENTGKTTQRLLHEACALLVATACKTVLLEEVVVLNFDDLVGPTKDTSNSCGCAELFAASKALKSQNQSRTGRVKLQCLTHGGENGNVKF